MESGYTITTATAEHLEVLSEIELAAATMFEGYVPASVPQSARRSQNSRGLSVKERFGLPFPVRPPLASPSWKC